MTTPDQLHRPFGATGIRVPPIAFRADVLSSPFLPDQTKRLICIEWMERIEPPVLIDVVHRGQHHSLLDPLGRMLIRLDIAPDDVVINLELDPFTDAWSRAKPHSIPTLFNEACDLLGKNHSPRLATLRFPQADDAITSTNFSSIVPSAVDSLRELILLKTRRQLAAVGIALRDWRLGQQLRDVTEFDFIKLLDGPTVLQHPPEMLEWLADSAARSTPIITAGVFHGGFLAGGPAFDGRTINSASPADQSLMTWRKSFAALCHGHGVRPAHACIQFALRSPGVIAASMSTSRIDRVAENVHATTTPVPDALWVSLKEEGLLAGEYPYLD